MTTAYQPKLGAPFTIRAPKPDAPTITCSTCDLPITHGSITHLGNRIYQHSPVCPKDLAAAAYQTDEPLANIAARYQVSVQDVRKALTQNQPEQQQQNQPDSPGYRSGAFTCTDCGANFTLNYLRHNDPEICTPCAWRRAESKAGPIRFADDDNRLYETPTEIWELGGPHPPRLVRIAHARRKFYRIWTGVRIR